MKRTKPVLYDGDQQLEDDALSPHPAGDYVDNGTWRHRRHVLRLMASGAQRQSQVVQAYEMAVRREKHMMNVLFDWSDHRG